MYNFYYHFPDHMPDDRWVLINHLYNVFEHAAKKAMMVHFLGSERPEVLEVWIRKKKGHKIRKFLITERPGDNLEFDISEKKCG